MAKHYSFIFAKVITFPDMGDDIISANYNNRGDITAFDYINIAIFFGFDPSDVSCAYNYMLLANRRNTIHIRDT